MQQPARLITALRPQPLDRLGLLTLLSSIYFFQIWGFTLAGSPDWSFGYVIKLALIGMSCAGVLLPRLYAVLIVNSLMFLLYFVLNSPTASNNQTLGFSVSILVLAGAAIAFARRTGAREGSWRDEMFRVIAGPGRWLLAIMYFYGIYHKINADFLNTEVSCAVALYQLLAMNFGLADWIVGKYAAIYATFFVEGIAMILLFSPRYRLIGIIIGVPFHIIIGWSGYAYYMEFSTIVLVLYSMFLPRVALERAFEAATRVVGDPARAALLGRLLLGGIFLGYLAVTGVFADIGNIVATRESFTWFFSLYALTFYAFAVAFVPSWRQPSEERLLAIRPAWLVIIPILFFVNGASPYLGLKTESSIAMYSNLHTEAGQTNHLIHGQLPFAWGYQNDIVVPISSNSSGFDARHVGKDQAMVRYELDRLLARRPELEVTFMHNGEVKSNGPDWRNTYKEASPLARGFLLFKPIDFARPKVCSH